jgi:hypothetical protein
MGIAPILAKQKTPDEILKDESEVRKIAQGYLAQLLTDDPRAVKSQQETERTFVMRSRPTEYVLNALSSEPETLKIFITQFPAIQADLATTRLITADFLLNYIENYANAYTQSGGVNRFARKVGIADEVKGFQNMLPSVAEIQQSMEAVDALSRGLRDADLRSEFVEILDQLRILQQSIPTAKQFDSLKQAEELGLDDNSASSSLAGEASFGVQQDFGEELKELISQLPTREYLQDATKEIAIALAEARSGREANNQFLEQLASDLKDATSGITRDSMMQIQGLFNRIETETRGFQRTLDENVEVNLKKGLVKEILDRYLRNMRDSTGRVPTREERRQMTADAEREALIILAQRRGQDLEQLLSDYAPTAIATSTKGYLPSVSEATAISSGKKGGADL